MFLRPRRIALVLALVAALGIAGWLGFYSLGRARASETLVLATTTSTYDSGLLDVLVPPFEEANDCRVDTVAVGTGQALSLGRAGDADVLLVHAPAAELQFMEEGHGLRRHPVMFNDFIIAGPPGDPAGVASTASAAEALARLAEAGERGAALFISRGDDSGTHKKELALWAGAGIEPNPTWYHESGSGMGDTLRMAAERGAYTLSDRATYLALFGPGAGDGGRLAVAFEGDPVLHNPYHVIIVNADAHPSVNARLAWEFAGYLLSDEARTIIETFGMDRFGRPLFQVLEEEPAGEAG